MPEKKRFEKTQPLPELGRTITEIPIAAKRAYEPFIKTFNYVSENIAKDNLGILIGIFEIDDQSDDSAYIVNFLASVAKKEYFANPRRGAIESFEAALHKLNLALAELVKHGNVAWLGNFHGAIGVFEKNNLHFSVAGNATIFLFRNQTLSDIADGLASEESRTNPIKTFVEISSGRLLDEDKVIVTSPELLALFSSEDIRKNAARMDNERFRQFLRTALRNEVDMAGTIVIDIVKPVPQPESNNHESKPHPRQATSNVFSQAAFATAERIPQDSLTPEESNVAPEIPNEYVDSKTGHIYIQGDEPDAPSSHPNMERFNLMLQETASSLRSFALSQARWMRKMRKQGMIAFDTISQEASIATRKTYRSLRQQWAERAAQIKETKRREAEERAKASAEAARQEMERQAAEKSTAQTISTTRTPEPPKPVTDIPTRATMPDSAVPEPEQAKDESLPPFIREKLSAFYARPATHEKSFANTDETIPTDDQYPHRMIETDPINQIDQFSIAVILSKIQTWLQPKLQILHEKFIAFSAISHRSIASSSRKAAVWVRFLKGELRTIFKNVSLFYRRLSSLHQKIVISGTIGLITLSFGLIWLISHGTNTSSIQNGSSSKTPTSSASSTTANTTTNEVTLLTSQSNAISAIAVLGDKTYIASDNNIIDLSDKKSYSLPSGAKIRFISSMDDLKLLFVYTSQKELYAWSPIAGTFVKNTLPLPEGIEIGGIGTYLTYLYIFDTASGQIYRFPRSDGGFGTPTAWMRGDLSKPSNGARIAVNETIFFSSDASTVKGYFRGRLSTTLVSPSSPVSITDLFSVPGTDHVYALDQTGRRIIEWDQTGSLIAQYASDSLSDASAFIVNEKTHEAIFVSGSSVFSFKLSR
jgi:hypothetical protein